MACPCDTCDETLTYGCKYCCSEPLSCAHIRGKDGECAVDLDCPEPCDTAEGRIARATIYFPPVEDLNSSGEGSWVKPPGGPTFWANVDAGNTAPADDGEGVVEVAISTFFPSADDVALSFDAAMSGNGFDVTGLGAVREVVREEVGAVSDAAESGPFAFDDVDLGLDPGDNPCQLPEVALPFDGYRPFLDLDDDEEDDHEACTADCADVWETALADCESFPEGSADRCECDQEANLDHAECAENCRVNLIDDWLAAIQRINLDERGNCCRGEYSTCVRNCEQTYFDAVKDSEDDYGIEERDNVIPYVAFAGGCGLPTDNPFGRRSIDDGARYQARACIVADRDVAQAEVRETRRNCITDCREAEMKRRKKCNARETRCRSRCRSAYLRAYDECAVCGGHSTGCIETALNTLATCQKDCCTAAHPWVLNEHALADCEWEAWHELATATIACCFGLETCVDACNEPGADIVDIAPCLQDCADAHETCGDGLTATYTEALELCRSEHLGDCPNCFSAPPLPVDSIGDCTVGVEYDGIVCQGLPDPEIIACPEGCSVDTGGICGTEAEPGCACPDTSCILTEFVNCAGVSCTRNYEACEMVSSDCPDDFTTFTFPTCAIPMPTT